jgi:hypothetical protein
MRRRGKMESDREGRVLTSQHLMQALEAAGADHNVVYMSVPITSGEREIKLLDEVAVTSVEELRTRHRDRWRNDVVVPNERAAECHASMVRGSSWAAGAIVVDPSRMHVAGWEQADYNGFWIELMARHVRQVVATPGWEFSKGARIEVAHALSLSLPVLDITGKELSPGQLREQSEQARSELSRRGWTMAQIDSYLPSLERDVHPLLRPSAQTQVFSWLTEQRVKQVAMFGPLADDAKTRSGALDPDGWWASQLARYWELAQRRGLDDSEGRLALAKYLATACALVESVVRVHGPLPRSPEWDESDA